MIAVVAYMAAEQQETGQYQGKVGIEVDGRATNLRHSTYGPFPGPRVSSQRHR